MWEKIKALVTLKSKTANFTALAAIVITLAKQMGYELPQDVVVGVFTVLAFILRMVTHKALESKTG